MLQLNDGCLFEQQYFCAFFLGAIVYNKIQFVVKNRIGWQYHRQKKEMLILNHVSKLKLLLSIQQVKLSPNNNNEEASKLEQIHFLQFKPILTLHLQNNQLFSMSHQTIQTKSQIHLHPALKTK
eukprot:TRINITY_DN2500_c0_g2_i1.p1 TRINITY_DN2500_c0_g2~~TRINITY_DN2500_c0_g2_i1.p1  ORF type:complete len:124 (-),score=0.54 TRINITY_DN2500_c0_g2_i1:6-377(-)